MPVALQRFASQVLRDNPMRDPHERHIPVYLPPGYESSDAHYPVAYFLAGFGGGGALLLGESLWGENLPQRLDRLIGGGACGR